MTFAAIETKKVIEAASIGIALIKNRREEIFQKEVKVVMKIRWDNLIGLRRIMTYEEAVKHVKNKWQDSLICPWRMYAWRDLSRLEEILNAAKQTNQETMSVDVSDINLLFPQ